ncbi:MAG TPA: SufD family Fe-S cluster assembly protein, partial [Candidatus Acidoferrales bacterium]|nr:SufD family Fe-S cluster assembly protein [Candidatus Acidoferrales bacterium]
MTQSKNSSELRIIETFRRTDPAGQPKWLSSLRNAGIGAFAELGFPTLRDEDWRFTNIAPIAALPFEPARAAAVNGAESSLLGQAVFSGLPGCRLVFVNGFFSTRLSRLQDIPGGVTVDSLSAGLGRDAARIERHLGKYARISDNAFAALNQAFFTDGAFIDVPQGVAIAEPIQVVYISSVKQAGETVQPRNLIIAGANSRATIVESYLSTGDTASFTNAVTEIIAGEGAVVEHVKLQDETGNAFHMATIAGEFGRASNVNVHSFALGSKLSRNNI